MNTLLVTLLKKGILETVLDITLSVIAIIWLFVTVARFFVEDSAGLLPALDTLLGSLAMIIVIVMSIVQSIILARVRAVLKNGQT